MAATTAQLTIRVPLSITIGEATSDPVIEFDLPLNADDRPTAIARALRALADAVEGVPDAAAQQ